MTATITCSYCGARLTFDSRIACDPTSDGWIEGDLPYWNRSHAIRIMCPRCKEKHAKIMDKDPFEHPIEPQ